jgi:NAD(P)-dependent dehydrogenase (short-subunit alcohol dehydrogenase family)
MYGCFFQFEQFATENTSLQRIGQVDEVAPVILFLASEAASYVTGAIWMVDGGMLVKGSKAITL